MSSTTDNYLHDLGEFIKERAREAKRDAKAAAGTDRHDFELGRLMALHEVVSLMQQQAEAFGLELSALALDGISPEKDLI
jgi:hypothetical protein